MKVVLFSLFLLLFIAGPMSAGAQAVAQLEPTAFKKKIATGKFILLDVRTPAEFASGHIDGAKNLDINRSDFLAEAKKLDASRPVLVYCLSGIRSDRAARVLLNNGFKTVYNLRGGTKAWSVARLPLVP